MVVILKKVDGHPSDLPTQKLGPCKVIILKKGPSIKYVSTFLAIFDPSLPHVSNCQHFETPPLKVRQHFQNLQPPSKEIKEINMLVKNSLHAIYMVKHSLIFVCKLLYQNVYDFVKRHLFLLLLLAKSADISTLDTPLPLMSVTVSISYPPLKVRFFTLEEWQEK